MILLLVLLFLKRAKLSVELGLLSVKPGFAALRSLAAAAALFFLFYIFIF